MEMSGPVPRGLNHVGIAVPDLDAAIAFLTDAVGAELLYRTFGPADPAQDGPDFERDTGSAAGATAHGQALVKVGTGPDLELFEMRAPEQAQAARASDLGLTHLAFYVDDILAAVDRFRQAGGRMLTEPLAIPYNTESGPGNKYCYGRAPWGTTIEFITYPSTMAYTGTTALRRWQDRTD